MPAGPAGTAAASAWRTRRRSMTPSVVAGAAAPPRCGPAGPAVPAATARCGACRRRTGPAPGRALPAAPCGRRGSAARPAPAWEPTASGRPAVQASWSSLLARRTMEVGCAGCAGVAVQPRLQGAEVAGGCGVAEHAAQLGEPGAVGTGALTVAPDERAGQPVQQGAGRLAGSAH